MCKTHHLWISVLAVIGSVSPATMARENVAPPIPWRVQFFVDPQKSDLVSINAGSWQGLHVGAILRTYRQSPSLNDEHSSPPVATGVLKVTAVGEGTSVAKIVAEGSEVAVRVFPNFARVMAGDSVVQPKYVVARIQEALPELSVSYFDLFVDPKAEPATFELTEKGSQALKGVAQKYAEKKFNLLLVSGYTDHNGNSSDNQVESYQRALAVRRYLVDALGFDDSRIVAMGMGEGEPADDSMVTGYRQRNRRIVFRVVPIASH